MPIISVRIPQLGEGLHEALLVDFLKQPGDSVKRDEPIYVMETDKATTDVESPYEGTLIEWTVETGSVLEIGTEIAKMEVAEGVEEMPAGHGPADSAPATTSAVVTDSTPVARKKSKIQIPPKTRKLLKEHGLLDLADEIPTAGSKLMPADVEAYLAAGGQGGQSSDDYAAELLPQSQVTLNFRLKRGTQDCIPVTVMNEVDWTALQSARAEVKPSGGPTGFTMALWCVVQALKEHDAFRSSLSSDGRTRHVYHRVNLGIAVALPGDQMVTAVVRGADEMDRETFFAAVAQQIEQARDGQDQADGSTTLTVSNIGKAGMRIGIPAIVAPAMATLAIGQTYPLPVPEGDSFRFQVSCTMTLSFDHRLANGVGAANFMNRIKEEIESFQVE
ncbi:MAG: 2-oxo acid dehydrogenase subunit E2 [Mariniblastus sp.]|nr:2-oxo acid dehydrogenase subunit E2 [Mariniblastus sp.]